MGPFQLRDHSRSATQLLSHSRPFQLRCHRWRIILILLQVPFSTLLSFLLSTLINSYCSQYRHLDHNPHSLHVFTFPSNRLYQLHSSYSEARLRRRRSSSRRLTRISRRRSGHKQQELHRHQATIRRRNRRINHRKRPPRKLQRRSRSQSPTIFAVTVED